MSEEGLQRTANKLIHVAQPIELDTGEFLAHLQELVEVSAANDAKAIREVIRRAVPTYHPKE